jgi:hypothetical protein
MPDTIDRIHGWFCRRQLVGIRDQNPDNTPAMLVVDNSVFHDNPGRDFAVL